MNRLRNIMLALGVTLTLGAWASWANAQDAQQPRKRPGADGNQVSGPLIPKGAEEKLNLSAEQKEKIAKIEKDFTDKAKDIETKVKEAMEKARADKDRAAYAKAQEELAEARKLRAAAETEVRAILTAEQKKLLEAAPAAQPTRPGAGGGLIPPALQERLELTEEQKQKLAELQKEFEGKAAQVLTEEQRKELEEFKTPRRRPQP